MKIVANKSKLHSELSAVASVIKGKSQLPVLSHVLMAVKDGSLFISGTDLDSYYTRQFKPEHAEDGSCLLRAGKLKEWLSLVNGDVTIVALGREVRLSTPESGSIKFSTLPVDEFPPPPAAKATPKPVCRADFSPLKHIIWSVSDSGGRPELEAVFIEPEEDGLVGVSADGKCLGRVKIKADSIDDGFNSLSIPSAYVGLAASLGECELLESDNYLHFRTPTDDLSVRKSEYKPPPWRKVLSQFPMVGSISVIREEMASVVRQCHIHRGGELGSENGVRVSFTKADGGVCVKCLVANTGDSYTHTIAGKQCGEFPAIALPTELLLPFFALPCEDLLKLELTGSQTVCKMNAGDVDYWFMPLVGNVKA